MNRYPGAGDGTGFMPSSSSSAPLIFPSYSSPPPVQMARKPTGYDPKKSRAKEEAKRTGNYLKLISEENQAGLQRQRDEARREEAKLMGSYINEEGLRRSARLAKGNTPDEPLLDALFDPPPFRRRGGSHKHRGGASDRYEAIIEAATSLGQGALNATKKLADASRAAGTAVSSAASSAVSAAGESALYQEGLVPIGEGLKSLGLRAGDMVYLGILAALSVPPLVFGLAEGTAGVIGRLFENLRTLNRRITGSLKDPGNQNALADAISKDIPTAVVVAIAAATQAGLLSLTTVVAVILRAFGTALTGTGRAVATIAIYVWYVGKTPAEKTAINTAATEYAVAAKERVAIAAMEGAEVAAKVGSKTAAATVVVAQKAGALASLVAEGAASGVAAVAEKVRGAAGAGAGSPPPPTAADVTAAAASLAKDPKEMRVAIGEAAVHVVEASTSGKTAAVIVPGSASRAEAEEILAEAKETAAVVEAAVAEEEPKIRKKGRGARGGRKTKKRSAKRRATRRRKAPKYLAAPVFAY